MDVLYSTSMGCLPHWMSYILLGKPIYERMQLKWYNIFMFLHLGESTTLQVELYPHPKIDGSIDQCNASDSWTHRLE